MLARYLEMTKVDILDLKEGQYYWVRADSENPWYPCLFDGDHINFGTFYTPIEWLMTFRPESEIIGPIPQPEICSNEHQP